MVFGSSSFICNRWDGIFLVTNNIAIESKIIQLSFDWQSLNNGWSILVWFYVLPWTSWGFISLGSFFSPWNCSRFFSWDLIVDSREVDAIDSPWNLSWVWRLEIVRCGKNVLICGGQIVCGTGYCGFLRWVCPWKINDIKRFIFNSHRWLIFVLQLFGFRVWLDNVREGRQDWTVVLITINIHKTFALQC